MPTLSKVVWWALLLSWALDTQAQDKKIDDLKINIADSTISILRNLESWDLNNINDVVDIVDNTWENFLQLQNEAYSNFEEFMNIPYIIDDDLNPNRIDFDRHPWSAQMIDSIQHRLLECDLDVWWIQIDSEFLWYWDLDTKRKHLHIHLDTLATDTVRYSMHLPRWSSLKSLERWEDKNTWDATIIFNWTYFLVPWSFPFTIDELSYEIMKFLVCIKSWRYKNMPLNISKIDFELQSHNLK